MTKDRKTMEFTRTKNDINGNGRYIVHFLNLLTQSEKDLPYDFGRPHYKFNIALRRAKTLGGKTYRGKDYAGGIVFQSVNNKSLEKEIKALVAHMESLPTQ